MMGYLLSAKFGDLPPILKFLDPFHGFWQNAESRELNGDKSFKLTAIKDDIEIVFDDKMIPHVFAQNNYDLYYAQGYVTAMHRLWQMDFQTRFAAGRIAEVIGAKAIDVDKYQRRMGMVYGAEKSLEGMMSDPMAEEMILAYTEGINEYIKSLNDKTLPVEYKLLNFKPEPWTPIKCALLLKQMSAVLAMGSDEFYMTNVLNKYGPEITKDLFPDYPFKEDPIIPVGTKWNFEPVKIPAIAPQINSMISAAHRTKEKIEGIGSNNWAVSGAKTQSGFPILANDPHLDLSLPSIWYQIQLHAPNVNTYGVSLPGAPGVIIGFNEHIAWGVTNVAADVLDFYQIKFKDDTHKAYWHNNVWKKTSVRLEKIKVKGGADIVDTVTYTHHGPVVYFEKPKYARAKNVPIGHALRWIAHDTSNELKTFFLLNRGKNYSDYREALTYYTAPAQNFVFASKENDIAITPNGKFPLKWKNQGKFILDGTAASNDWQGFIPANHNPTVKNPARNFVSSANQSSTDTTYPYYLNWEFSPYERGKRINDRLSVMKDINVDSMRNLQMDDYSILAENLLPYIKKHINIEQLNATEKEALAAINKWNMHFEANSVAASIFDVWAKRLQFEIWEDDFNNDKTPMRYPARDRTIEMIQKTPDAKWFDNVTTKDKVETLAELVNTSFKYACDSLERKFGPIKESWHWGKLKNTNVPHLAKIPGFGSKKLAISGAKSTVNAMSENNGPSWRMVVALGDKTKGFGVYPGGQSGNPGSFYYDNMIDTWAEGKLYELFFMQSPSDANGKIISKYKLTKK